MKKYIFIAVAALIASAACTKTELARTPDVPVSFSVANYKSGTRAADPTAAANSFLRIDDHFSSAAFLHAEGVDLNSDGTVKTDSYQNFFGNASPWTETISWDSSNKKWAPAQTYYWPKGTQSFVNFVSWYGATPTLSYAYDATASKWTATMTFAAAALTASSDILYADMAWRQKANVSSYHVDDASVTGVPTVFRHGLSRIVVKAYVQNGNDDIVAGPTDGNATWTVTVKNLTIGSVTTGASLVLTNADPGSNTTQQWTATLSGGSAANIAQASPTTGVAVEAAAISANAATAVLPMQSVLPQTIASTVKMTFDVDIVATYTNGATHHELLHKEIALSAFGTSEWVKNTQYTYLIKVNPSQNEVLYDPEVAEDWQEATTTEQEI